MRQISFNSPPEGPVPEVVHFKFNFISLHYRRMENIDQSQSICYHERINGQTMDIGYNDSEAAERVASRTQEFMDEVVLPLDRELPGGETVSQETIDELREQAREYDVYAPQMPEEYGGLGLSFRDALLVFEEAGRSLLGPPALRVDAPDEGNMHLLEIAGTEAQKDEWLRPLVDAKINSAFSMTEPTPGGGSDPKTIKTTAELDGDEWVINGHKWWTSNAIEAEVFIVLARTDQESHPYSGCSTILVPTDAAGLDIVRDIPHLGDYPVNMSHAEVKYDDVRVPKENLLGKEGEGFTLAQKRLGPARLTHCMRYSGMARRAIEVAKAYMSERETFGDTLTNRQSLRFDLAEAETNLHAAQSMIRHAADLITSDEEARIPVSMCKIFTANVTQDVIDTSLQMCGANGIGKDLPIADFYEYVRQFRIVDGPDEVHKRTVARELFDEIHEEEMESLTRYEEQT
jgi:acyl-CoA dehydrogenase